MITGAEVRRSARQAGVDPMIVDRDHALSVILRALSASSAGRDWVFKGGTCVRKAYFADYRFSEDLDFGLLVEFTDRELTLVLEEIVDSCRLLRLQMDLRAAKRSVAGEGVDASIDVRIPYRGALDVGGDVPKMRFHLTPGERLAFAPVSRRFIHPYTDAEDLACNITCYSVEEIATEKLRALAGQRVHAVARDLYDLWQLIMRGVDEDAVLAALPGKAMDRDVALRGCVERLAQRREALKASWQQSLDYLVTAMEDRAFELAFGEATRLLARLG